MWKTANKLRGVGINFSFRKSFVCNEAMRGVGKRAKKWRSVQGVGVSRFVAAGLAGRACLIERQGATGSRAWHFMTTFIVRVSRELTCKTGRGELFLE